MFIYHSKGAYIRPHKHLNKEESFHLISGDTGKKFNNISENKDENDKLSKFRYSL